MVFEQIHGYSYTVYPENKHTYVTHFNSAFRKSLLQEISLNLSCQVGICLVHCLRWGFPVWIPQGPRWKNGLGSLYGTPVSHCLVHCSPSNRLWIQDCTVPYTIDADFTMDERAVIASSIMDIEAASNVRWVPRTDPNNPFYVRIKKDEAGCFANVGRTANGIMNLGTNCVVR